MPGFPELSGRLSDGIVELRLVAEWDIPDILVAHQDDPRLHGALGMDRPPSGAELGRAIERAPDEAAAGLRLELTIVEPGSEDCRGRVEVHPVRWEQRTAELRIWVAPPLRGRGVARRALRLACAWLFDACGFEGLTLTTEPSNQAMLRAAAGAGFLAEPGGASGGLIRLALRAPLRAPPTAGGA